MNFVTVEVSIEGLTAMLQHRFGENAEVDSGKATRKINLKSETPREQAEKVCYRATNNQIYFPSAAVLRLLREAGGSHKQRGSRKSLKYIIPAAVRMSEEFILLTKDGVEKEFLTDFEVDSRSVVIPATKGRIMRHRPRLDKWGAHFRLVINEDVLGEATVHQLLQEGGQQIGLGDFRPEKGGPFGCFRVTRWEKLPAA